MSDFFLDLKCQIKLGPCGEMASRLTTIQCDQEIAGSTPVSVIFFSS